MCTQTPNFSIKPNFFKLVCIVEWLDLSVLTKQRVVCRGSSSMGAFKRNKYISSGLQDLGFIVIFFESIEPIRCRGM